MRARYLAIISCFSLTSLASCAPASRFQQAAAPSSMLTACSAGPFDAASVEGLVGPATVLIATNEGVGSGFVIREGQEELVVTNYHFVASGRAPSANLPLPDGRLRQTQLEVVKVSRDHDLALLRPVASLGATPLPLSVQAPTIGAPVAAVGYPGIAGSKPVRTFEPGTITATERQVSAVDFIQTNVNINAGNSGGPLVDACGRVVGVVTARHRSAERVGLAIPARAVTELVAEYKKPELAPEVAAQAQLQRLFTEVKFRRSERVSQYFTRHFAEDTMASELVRLAGQGSAKIEQLKLSLRKKGRELTKLPREELVRELTQRLTPQELKAVELTAQVEQKQVSSIDAAKALLAHSGADVFGNLDDIWLENTSSGKKGCIDAYVTVSHGAETRRWLAHLHHENGEWLVDSITLKR